MKVIYHINTMEAWTMTLGNVRNMLDWLHQNQESYEIEVLANGPAVRGYLPGILPDSLNVVIWEQLRATTNPLSSSHPPRRTTPCIWLSTQP